MSTEYRAPQWLLPNEKNLALPADGATTGSGLAEDRQSLYSMDFNGVSNWINLGDNDFGLAYDKPLSISAWVNQHNAGEDTVVSKRQAGGAYTGWEVRILSTGEVRFLFSENGFSAYINTTSTTQLSPNTWYHIAVTYDGSVDPAGFKIYINGSPETVSSDTQPALPPYVTTIATTTAASIGARGATNLPFDGNIDEVSIFDKELSSDEVTTLWNSGSPGNAMILNPKGYYPVGEQARTGGSQDVGIADWQFPNQSLANHALYFNGSSDYINLASTTPVSTSFTVGFWNYNPSIGSYDTIVGSPVNTGGLLYALAMTTTGELIYADSVASWRKLTGPTDTGSGRPDKWYFIAVTYDSATDVLKGYLDGVLEYTYDGNVAGQEISWAGKTTNAHSFSMIGARATGTGLYLGRLSNVSYFDTALPLSGAESITSLYNNGNPPEIGSYSNLQAWYKLDSSSTFDGTNWTIPDDSTNNNPGTSTGMTQASLVSSDLQFESPYSNFSLEFDGTNDYIDATPTLSGLSSISISGWVKFTNINNADFQYVFNSTNPSSTADAYAIGIAMIKSDYSTVGDRYKIYSIDGPSLNITSFVVSEDVWYNVVVTQTGTTRLVYVDGVQVGSFTVPVLNLGNAFEIGRWSSANHYIPGNIDEVAIWDSALTATQVTQVYNNGYPRDLTFLSPTAWWRLGEDAYFISPNFTIPNKISGGVNGVTVNMDDSDLVASAPGSYASGVGNGLDVFARVGDARESTGNSVSYNMIPANKIPYPSGYVPTQVDNDYAMEFNGLDQYVYLGTPTELNLTGDMSISAWIYTDTIALGAKVIVCDCNTPPSQSQFCLEINRTAGKISALANGTTVALTGSTTLSISTWYHVALTRSGSTGSWDYVIYLNGVVDGSTNTASNPSAQQGAAIGRFGESASGYFDGKIDEVALFDYALSANQVQQDIYKGGRDPKCADLNNISNLTAPVAWYRMGD